MNKGTRTITNITINAMNYYIFIVIFDIKLGAGITLCNYFIMQVIIEQQLIKLNIVEDYNRIIIRALV